MISILTPTYNRGYILPFLYNSLLRQTCKKFEWIIIDDGSTDNTKSLVDSWLSISNNFDIKFLCQDNGGKCRALNQGIKLVNSDYCFIVDSDDHLIEDAVMLIHMWIKTIDANPMFAGVSGLKGYISGGIIGSYPRGRQSTEYIDTFNTQRSKYKLMGDKAEVYRTSILKKYPFPEFEGENYLNESAVWNAISLDGYKIRWFNRIICLCEYRSDGLTKMGLSKYVNNFKGYSFIIKQQLKFKKGLLKIKVLNNYAYAARQNGFTIRKAAENVGVSPIEICFGFVLFALKKTIRLVLK